MRKGKRERGQPSKGRQEVLFDLEPEEEPAAGHMQEELLKEGTHVQKSCGAKKPAVALGSAIS